MNLTKRGARAAAELARRRADARSDARAARRAQERRVRRQRKAIDRAEVFERDRGFCALCGCDTQRLARWLAELPGFPDLGKAGRYGVRDRFTVTGRGNHLGRHSARALTLLGRLWRVRIDVGAHLWEADHRVPIAEGGSDELSNLRTLCRRCHCQQSADLRARLARRPTKAVGRGF